MHTWYTYPVSIGHGGRWAHREETRCRSGRRCWRCWRTGPMYGYQLRVEFEQRTGSTWPLNVGQVYTTLSRLERDGLVEQVVGEGADHDTDDGSHVTYRVTEAGRGEVSEWFTTPVPRTQPPRDELAIKLALAVHGPRRRRRHAHPAPAQRHDGRAPGLHPAQALAAAPHAPTSPRTSPGAWCSTRWSSTRRPRSGGSTTARPGCVARRSRATDVRRDATAAARRGRRRRRPVGACDERPRAAPRRGDPRPRRGRDRGARPARRLASARTPASWWPSWGRPGPASPPC